LNRGQRKFLKISESAPATSKNDSKRKNLSEFKRENQRPPAHPPANATGIKSNASIVDVKSIKPAIAMNIVLPARKIPEITRLVDLKPIGVGHIWRRNGARK